MWHACRADKTNMVGVMTTEEVKINMVNTARSLLEEKRLRVLRDTICEGRRNGLRGLEKSASITRLLAEQLKRLQQRIKPARDVFGTTRAKISGKMGSYQDDLAIAFLFGLHWTMQHIFGGGIPITRV